MSARRRHTIFFLGCLLALDATLPHATRAASASGSASQKTPAARLVAQQEDAYNAKDLESFLACYADDAVLTDLLTGREDASGKEALRARYSVRFSQSPDQRATIVKRLAVGAYVVDHESLVWKKDAPPVESLLVYLVQNSKIARVWLASFDAKSIAPAPGAIETVNELVATTNTHGLNRTIDLFDPRLETRILAANSTVLHSISDLRRELMETFDENPVLSVELVDTIVVGAFVAAHERFKGESRRDSSEDLVLYEIFGGKIRRMWVTPRALPATGGIQQR